MLRSVNWFDIVQSISNSTLLEDALLTPVLDGARPLHQSGWSVLKSPPRQMSRRVLYLPRKSVVSFLFEQYKLMIPVGVSCMVTMMAKHSLC